MLIKYYTNRFDKRPERNEYVKTEAEALVLAKHDPAKMVLIEDYLGGKIVLIDLPSGRTAQHRVPPKPLNKGVKSCSENSTDTFRQPSIGLMLLQEGTS